MSFVEGSYATPQEAVAAVNRLQAEGYKKEDIRLVSSSETRGAFKEQSPVSVTAEDSYDLDDNQTTEEDDRSIWEKMKDAFSTDDEDYSNTSEDDPLYAYKEDITAGNIVVVVDGQKGAVRAPKSGPTDVKDNLENDEQTNTTDNFKNDEQTIQLQEEKLEVDKNKVQTGEVEVSKRVVEETKTVEVPVEREEIVIERKKVNDSNRSDGDMEDKEFTIPVSEEQIEVTKKPVVTEEVKIDKEKVQDTKQVKETVEKETLNVDTDGDVEVDDKNNKKM